MTAVTANFILIIQLCFKHIKDKAKRLNQPSRLRSSYLGEKNCLWGYSFKSSLPLLWTNWQWPKRRNEERSKMCSHPYKTIEKGETQHKYRKKNVKIFGDTLSSSFWEGQREEWRRALAVFKNMLFLKAEDALLEARKASSSPLLITYWFIVCYKLNYYRHYTFTVKMYTFALCHDFSSFYWLFRNKE